MHDTSILLFHRLLSNRHRPTLKVKPSNINLSHKDCFVFTHSFGIKSRGRERIGKCPKINAHNSDKVREASVSFCLGREAVSRGDDGRGFVDIFSVKYMQVLSFHEYIFILKKQCFASLLLTVTTYRSVCMTQVLILDL